MPKNHVRQLVNAALATTAPSLPIFFTEGERGFIYVAPVPDVGIVVEVSPNYTKLVPPGSRDAYPRPLEVLAADDASVVWLPLAPQLIDSTTLTANAPWVIDGGVIHFDTVPEILRVTPTGTNGPFAVWREVVR